MFTPMGGPLETVEEDLRQSCSIRRHHPSHVPNMFYILIKLVGNKDNNHWMKITYCFGHSVYACESSV